MWSENCEPSPLTRYSCDSLTPQLLHWPSWGWRWSLHLSCVFTQNTCHSIDLDLNLRPKLNARCLSYNLPITRLFPLYFIVWQLQFKLCTRYERGWLGVILQLAIRVGKVLLTYKRNRHAIVWKAAIVIFNPYPKRISHNNNISL